MKRFILLTAGLMAFPLAQAAPMIDIYGGGYRWDAKLEGTVSSDAGKVDTDKDLGFDDGGQNVIYLGLEHFVPLVPNVRLRHMDFSDDSRNQLTRNVTFDGQTFTATTDVASSLDLELLDGTLYYSPLDNMVKLNVGLTVRRMDADVQIRGSGQEAREEGSQTFPLGHASARVNLPFTGAYVGGEVNAIKYSGSSMSDFNARIGWQSDYLLGVELGYNQLNVKLDDVGGLDSDLEIGGPYLAATLSF